MAGWKLLKIVFILQAIGSNLDTQKEQKNMKIKMCFPKSQKYLQ